ncbi:MAG: iron-sulfur cluster assembly protein [Alphaproteobacteria bacterium]|nr:iron-sulfur cluster assembly protein [Alphaproteobacteria bacterium]
MRDEEMDLNPTEPQGLTETCDEAESSPHEPKWFFDPSIPAEDRVRYTNDIIAALKTVFDPEIPCDIYELGLVYRVEVDGEYLAKIDMTLTAPGCPVAGELTRSIESAVGAVAGLMGVMVNVVFDPPWDQGRMSDEAHIALDFF